MELFQRLERMGRVHQCRAAAHRDRHSDRLRDLFEVAPCASDRAYERRYSRRTARRCRCRARSTPSASRLTPRPSCFLGGAAESPSLDREYAPGVVRSPLQALPIFRIIRVHVSRLSFLCSVQRLRRRGSTAAASRRHHRTDAECSRHRQQEADQARSVKVVGVDKETRDENPRTSAPAAIRTCRSKGMTFVSLTVGRPVDARPRSRLLRP